MSSVVHISTTDPFSSRAPALRFAFVAIASALAIISLQGCAHRDSIRRDPDDRRGELGSVSYRETGLASWYGAKFAGKKTASGEKFDPSALTAAHRTLPFGSVVEVRRVDTGYRVRVRVTDRGPYGHSDRIIDLSRAAAERLDMVRDGVAKVEVVSVGAP